MVYRWYKILSPHIDVAVDGIGMPIDVHQEHKD